MRFFRWTFLAIKNFLLTYFGTLRFVREVGLPPELYTVLCQPRYTYEYDLNNNKGAPFVVSNYSYLHTTFQLLLQAQTQYSVAVYLTLSYAMRSAVQHRRRINISK